MSTNYDSNLHGSVTSIVMAKKKVNLFFSKSLNDFKSLQVNIVR